MQTTIIENVILDLQGFSRDLLPYLVNNKPVIRYCSEENAIVIRLKMFKSVIRYYSPDYFCVREKQNFQGYWKVREILILVRKKKILVKVREHAFDLENLMISLFFEKTMLEYATP